ncbi:ketopantoate reductase family protein [Paraburkholderia phenoliruptrix]|uniref:ketopantoate reductase family protein n=1 Tax=Paraburkholderia phenoliruptrix TaxID=252970 RepID=UPI001C6EC1B1|nr:ketopantoate reductase family protein [Paraburkholderia phenoliruptrix]MBW9102654.1 ketopantoate reductase family protein [Paraburkholderia phenoliruptrix]MBW9128937.1 ketopantoate reductase family protein [Paraburkholderia ginsengiterrae]
MKVAVMGAGAVGCFYGGMLARAGHAVTLIGRLEHVSAIEQRGLRFESAQFDEYVPVSASTDAKGVANAELVLFCVKSSDTEEAALAMRPYLESSAFVLTLQNGVDNAERVRSVIPQQVSSAAVYVACEMAGAGHVRHHGSGELIIEKTFSGSQHIAQILNSAGIGTELSTNVRGALWGKLILNCAYNAMSALTQLPFGELRRRGGHGVEIAMRDIVAECIAVGRADGVGISSDADQTVRTIMETIPAGQYSSTAQDLSRGRRSEIEHLNGHIARRGAALGIPTPVNHLLLVLVNTLDNRSPQGEPA